MKLNRVKIVVLCLGVALLVMTASAMAGTTTTSASGPFRFAREVAVANALYNFPAAPCGSSTLFHQMNVIRSFNFGTGSPANYFVDIALDGGAVFSSVPGATNGAIVPDITVTNEPTIVVYRVIDPSFGFPAVPTNRVRYYITITAAEIPAIPTINISLTNFQVRDVNNVLGAGGTINATVTTTDAASGVAFDATAGDSTAAASPAGFMTGGGFGAAITSPLVTGHAFIDVFTNRTTFVPATNVTTVADSSATLGINDAVSGVLAANGCPYALTALSSIQLIITGNFTGVTEVSYGSFNYFGPFFNTGTTIMIPGNNPNFNGSTQHITITVNGVSQLVPQDWQIQVNEILAGTPDGPPINSRNLLPTSILTMWRLNGTVLTAIFQNGNNAAFNGRLYLWNPSSQIGVITATVYTLPTPTAAGPPLNAPSTLLGSVTLSNPAFNLPALGGTSGGGLNLRVYDDILANIPANADPKVQWLGAPAPYTFNGGNIVVVLSISATDVRGWSNVFSGAFSFGVVPMLVTLPQNFISIFD